MSSSHFALFLLLSIVMEVHSLPGGAPAAACADILPQGHIDAGHSSMDVTTIPYLLDLSVFDSDGGQSYEPGMTYISESNTYTRHDTPTPTHGYAHVHKCI